MKLGSDEDFKMVGGEIFLFTDNLSFHCSFPQKQIATSVWLPIRYLKICFFFITSVSRDAAGGIVMSSLQSNLFK